MVSDTGLIRSISNRISATRLSELLKEQLWVVPTSQSIHIIAVSIVFVCALLISFRLLGIGRSERPVSGMIKKQSRMINAGLFTLLFTGTIQTIAEPDRQFGSPAFWLKMLLIVFALLLTYWLARNTQRDPQRWDLAASRPAWSRIHAVIYVAAWAAIIFCGRFIGYT